MSPAPVGHARAWTSRRSIAVLTALAVLLATAGTLIQLSQSDARHRLEERFKLRITLGGGFVRSYLDDFATREQEVGLDELAGAEVPEGALGRAAHALGLDVAVLLDETGSLIQIVPHRAEMIGTNLSASYEHLRQAVAGETAVSDVVFSANEGLPVIAVATPFDTPYGRRVLSGGFLAAQTPLAAYLRAAVPITSAATYLVDGKGDIVASNLSVDAGAATVVEALDPVLAGAIALATDGRYQDSTGSQYFAVQPVENTRLRLVATVSAANLYAPISGAGQWIAWIVLASLGVVAVYLVRVLGALSRTQSELGLATNELERSNRELQDFAGIASHDLQEPLRKIQSFGDRLVKHHGATLDEEGRDYLERMLDAAGRMQTLIQDLLTWSRVRSRPEELQDVELSLVVSEVLEDLEVRLQKDGAKVIVGPLPTIMASPLQMGQLFQNLIANALKFHRSGVPPVVRVDAKIATHGSRHGGLASKPAWEIRVADNGIGFDAQYAEKIFAPFQRLHGRTAYEGTGMGLAICRGIVERLGGTLTATSAAGEGATFLIVLPASGGSSS